MKLFSMIFAALIVFANSAQAESTYATTIENWELRYDLEKRYCYAYSSYLNQKVAFNIDPWKEKLELQIYDTKWKAPTGQYDVHFRVDSVQSNKQAHFVGNSLFLDFEINKSAFELFQYGREMWVTAKNGRWGYQLNGTYKMLPELVRCAVSLKRVIEGESNPFGSANSNNEFGGSSNPFTGNWVPVEVDPFN